RRQLTAALGRYITKQRWFAGKARRVQDIDIVDAVPVEPRGRELRRLLIVSLEYAEGEPETYALPVVVMKRPRTAGEEDSREDVIAELDAATSVALCDGSGDPQLACALFDLVRRGRTQAGAGG